MSWRRVGCEGLHNELIQLMQVCLSISVHWGGGYQGGGAGVLGTALHGRACVLPGIELDCPPPHAPFLPTPPTYPQGYKAQLAGMGQWEAAMASLEPAVQQKLSAMCQL